LGYVYKMEFQGLLIVPITNVVLGQNLLRRPALVWPELALRECLDHVAVFGEKHLRRLLREYIPYDHGSRTRLGLGRDTPEPRATQHRDAGAVVSMPVLGGLPRRYWRQAA
jgi:hypothetical protein